MLRGGYGEALRFKEVKEGRRNCVGRRLDRGVRVKTRIGRESEEWGNKLKEKQQTAAMGQINGGWCRNRQQPDFGVQGMVVSRRMRPFPAAAVHLFR